MIDSDGRYDYCRFYVDAPSRDDVRQRLAALDRYSSDERTLRARGVWIDIMRNENAPTDGYPDFLFWPVTFEVFRDDGDTEVTDATMLAVVRRLKSDVEAFPARVVVAAEFEDEV